MLVKHRVFVSSPRDEWLSDDRKLVKHGIIRHIQTLGFEPQFFDLPGGGDLAISKAWNFASVQQVVRGCVGAVIIGLCRWIFTDAGREIFLASEYCHYEGSLAYALDLPTVVLAEKGIEGRGTFIPYGGHQIVRIPLEAGSTWLDSKELASVLKNWKQELDDHRDVFFGYCSTSSKTAQLLKAHLEKLGVTVLDWQSDFRPGRSILEEIEQSVRRCRSAIFLFTQDDKLAKGTATHEASPRDNVIFEAGYFISAKGKGNVLIVVETGTKIPADLGGDIYARLEDKSDIRPIKQTVLRFLQSL
jgi:hypothetical protein